VAEDTWSWREKPILEALASKEDSGGPTMSWELATSVDLTEDDFKRGLRALYESGFIAGDSLVAEDFILGGVRLTERGRRAVGQWPSQDLASELVQLLGRMVDSEPDSDQKGRLKRLQTAVTGVGTDLLAKVISELLTRGLP